MEGSVPLSLATRRPKAQDEAWPGAGEVREQKDTSGPKPGPGPAPA